MNGILPVCYGWVRETWPECYGWWGLGLFITFVETVGMNFHLDIKALLTVTFTLFAIIDIIGSIPILIALKDKMGGIRELRATIISGALMVLFLFLGEPFLQLLGLDVKSFAVGGSIVTFVGKAGNDALHGYRLTEVNRAFDVLVNEPFDFNDLIIDLKSKGVTGFDPGTFFPGPLIFADFNGSRYSVVPGNIALFNTDMNRVQARFVVFISPVHHHTHTWNTHHTKVVFRFLKKTVNKTVNELTGVHGN